MAPKKNQGQKMSLNEFLGEQSLGSWADEMDSMPDGPAPKTDDDRSRGGNFRDRDYPDRGPMPMREELPLPTAPPYTAFIGNLAFDLVEADLDDFFQPSKLKNVKIIKDREEKPKGFGYVEFETLDGLKDGLSRSGGSLANRQVRVSVADAPKERSGPGGFDDEKFESNWRRSGPLPPSSPTGRGRDGDGFGARGGPGRSGPPPTSGEAESNIDWRSNRVARPPSIDKERPPVPRRGSGFMESTGGGGGGGGGGGANHAADSEESWSMGSKFKPSAPSPSSTTSPPDAGAGRGMFGGRKGDAPSRSDSIVEESDWRSAPRKTPAGNDSRSPTTSTPPTPQLARRKLELLPRTAGSADTSPASASGPAPARANPFGAAKPIDAAAREKEIEGKLEKEHTAWLSSRPTRTLSNTPRARGTATPPQEGSAPTTPTQPASTTTPSSPAGPRFVSKEVKTGFSFAAAAGKKSAGDSDTTAKAEQKSKDPGTMVQELEDKIAQVSV